MRGMAYGGFRLIEGILAMTLFKKAQAIRLTFKRSSATTVNPHRSAREGNRLNRDDDIRHARRAAFCALCAARNMHRGALRFLYVFIAAFCFCCFCCSILEASSDICYADFLMSDAFAVVMADDDDDDMLPYVFDCFLFLL